MSVLDNLRSPKQIRCDIALRMKKVRLSQNISQAQLATESGVTLSTVRRFEQTGEVSLKYLVNMAITLNRAEDFSELFRETPPVNLFEKEPTPRVRASGARK